MISPAASFKVFGVSMQRQRTRRKLVVWVYAVLAMICAIAIYSARYSPTAFSFAMDAALAASYFIFGGLGRYGLIKSFYNKPPRPEPVMVDVVRLQLAPETLFERDTNLWKNDERELGRRDLAHYRAYGPLSIALTFITVLASIALHPWPWLTVEGLLVAIFSLALLGTVISLTLPPAIILWTEPDMDSLDMEEA